MDTAAAPSVTEVQTLRVNEKIRRELGPMICGFLVEPDVVEILLNPDGRLWVEHLGKSMEAVGGMAAHQAEALISTVAATLKTTVTRESPILECELPLDGSRFEAMIPPVVPAPTFTIRRKAVKVFTFDDYVAAGIMTSGQARTICEAVDDHHNILVVGGTGSGKTTLTNAIIEYMARRFPQERLVIIEDTAELQCKAENHVPLRANAHTDMLQLLKATMRLRPDRILVGEVRGGEALALLKAWNTGHPGGVATVHADDAAMGLMRIEELVSEASATPRHQMIARTIHVVVFIKKTAGGRRVQQVARVTGHDGQFYSIQNIED